MLGSRASQRLGPYRLTSMASRALKPYEIDVNEIAIDSGVEMEAVGSIKTEMTKRTTAKNPYEALLPHRQAGASARHPGGDGGASGKRPKRRSWDAHEQGEDSPRGEPEVGA